MIRQSNRSAINFKKRPTDYSILTKQINNQNAVVMFIHKILSNNRYIHQSSIHSIPSVFFLKIQLSSYFLLTSNNFPGISWCQFFTCPCDLQCTYAFINVSFSKDFAFTYVRACIQIGRGLIVTFSSFRFYSSFMLIIYFQSFSLFPQTDRSYSSSFSLKLFMSFSSRSYAGVNQA